MQSGPADSLALIRGYYQAYENDDRRPSNSFSTPNLPSRARTTTGSTGPRTSNDAGPLTTVSSPSHCSMSVPTTRTPWSDTGQTSSPGRVLRTLNISNLHAVKYHTSKSLLRTRTRVNGKRTGERTQLAAPAGSDGCPASLLR